MQCKAYLKFIILSSDLQYPKPLDLLIIKTVLLDYKNTRTEEYRSTRIQKDKKT